MSAAAREVFRTFDGRVLAVEPEGGNVSRRRRAHGPSTWQGVAVQCPFNCGRRVCFGMIKPHAKAHHPSIEAGQWNAASPQLGALYRRTRAEALAVFNPERWGRLAQDGGSCPSSPE